jgi:Na+-transporting NADH:ubiquinone oxidoreductase subunit NqrB
MIPQAAVPVLAPGAVTTASAAAPAPPGRRRVALDSRFVAPVFITLILIGAWLSFGILESPYKTGLAIATSILTELALGRALTGRWPHLASAYISGISCGILVRSPEWWPYLLVPMVSIVSKYVIRWKGRHLWNPSNLGIAAALFLAPDAVASLSVQWGNTVWPMVVIWTLGAIIVTRLRRLHICATYVGAFLAFAVLRHFITGHTLASEVAPITGPMYQLFIFFMITDPKTTVTSKRGQMLVAVLVAFAEHLLRLGQSVHAPYYALTLVGPAANVVDIWLAGRRKKRLEGGPASGAAPAAPAAASPA